MYLEFPQGRYKLFGEGATAYGAPACPLPGCGIAALGRNRFGHCRRGTLPCLTQPQPLRHPCLQVRWCSPRTSTLCCAWGSARCSARTCWRAWCARSACMGGVHSWGSRGGGLSARPRLLAVPPWQGCGRRTRRLGVRSAGDRRLVWLSRVSTRPAAPSRPPAAADCVQRGLVGRQRGGQPGGAAPAGARLAGPADAAPEVRIQCALPG